MSTRMKPTPYIVETRAQAEGTLAEMAALDRKLAAIEAEMQEAMDLARARAAQAATPLQARRKELGNGVAVWAKMHKAELFAASRSLDLGFGTLGFRASVKVVQMDGINADMTVDRCKQYGFSDGLRVKEEPNKETMLAWPDERLALVGVRRQKSDTFFIEINADKLPQHAA